MRAPRYRLLAAALLCVLVPVGCATIEGLPRSLPGVSAPACPSNTTFQCASPLQPGYRDSDVFGREARYYHFSLNQPTEVSFTLSPMPNSRGVVVTIHDAQFNEIHRQPFRAGQPGSFAVTLRSPGRYYAKLTPGSCCSGSPNTYTFAISR